MSYSGTLTLTQPAAQRVFQRDTRTGGAFGKGAGAVTLILTPSVAVSLLEFQLRDALSPTNVLVPWSTAATNIAGSTQALTLSVPANAAWYLIDFRAEGDTNSIISTTAAIGVGEVIAAAGQSLATDFWSMDASGDSTTLVSLGIVVSPFCSALAAWNGAALPTSSTAWAAPSDTGAYRSSFAAEFLRLVVAATGVNAALVGYAHSGTDIATYWLPTSQGGDYVRLASVLNVAGGRFSAFIWCQGHNDADARTGSQYHLTPASTYVTYLQTVLGSLTSAFPAMAFRQLLCAIPAIGTPAASKYSVLGIEAIRSAHLGYVASNSRASYIDGLDVGLVADGIHPSQAGNVTFARHFYRAFLKAIGATTSGDEGPKLTGPGRRMSGSATITIPVQQAAGTAFSTAGDPANQFQIFASGQTASALPISSVDLSNPQQISITLATVPVDTQAVDIWYRYPLDSSAAILNGIYDNNNSGGDGLTIGRQLSMMPVALSVPAPAQAWHRPALIRPGVPMSVSPGSFAFTG